MDCAAVSFTQTEINSNMITVTWCGEGKWWCWVGPWVEMGRQAGGRVREGKVGCLRTWSSDGGVNGEGRKGVGGDWLR